MPNNNSSLPYSIPNHLGLAQKGLSEIEASMSPTSPLETKHFPNPGNNQKSAAAPIGLALVDVLHNEPKSDKKLFLKIQVPSISSPKSSSPIEFGVKTKDSQLALLRSPLSFDARPSWPSPCFSPQFLTDMELSEDYTCVISHGPTPKTTHIFNNCVVESFGENGFVSLRKESDFLRFCCGCKKSLSQGEDIFMYRGGKAFCSEDCRRREMLLEEGNEKFSQDLSDLL